MDLAKKVEELIVEATEESKPEKNDGVDNLKEFFSMLLGSKLVGHIHHLRSESYSEHIALGEFYKSAGKIADSVIEVYQGCYGCIIKYDAETLVYGSGEATPAAEYLSELRWAICEGRKLPELAEQSHIQNEIDNFVTLIDQTVYKLTFLT